MRREGGENDELFDTKPASQCSIEHYESLKLNLKACDSCWLVIGIHRKKTHPLGCVTCILSVEHGMKETVAPSGEEKQRGCLWQRPKKYNRKPDKCQHYLLPEQSFGAASLPKLVVQSLNKPSINYQYFAAWKAFHHQKRMWSYPVLWRKAV